MAGDERSVRELEHLSRLMEQQGHLEEQVVARCQEEGDLHHPEAECRAPPPCDQFQTARLILSHLGLLSIGALRVSLENKKFL